MTAPQLTRSVSELLEALTDRDLLILKDLEQFRLLSTRQIQRLQFTGHATISAATRTAVRVLNRLEGHRLIARLPRRIGGPIRGSAANVWQLANTGERLLRRLSGQPERRRYVEPSPKFTAHTLAVADVAITVLEAAAARRFEVLALQTEPECWREHTGAAGAREWLKPDLAVVTANTAVEAHSFIEVDRGTEHLPAVLRKCESYQRYWRTGTEQSTHELFPAVVWIVPDDHRASKIRSALREHPGLDEQLFQITTPPGALNIISPDDTQPLMKGGTP